MFLKKSFTISGESIMPNVTTMAVEKLTRVKIEFKNSFISFLFFGFLRVFVLLQIGIKGRNKGNGYAVFGKEPSKKIGKHKGCGKGIRQWPRPQKMRHSHLTDKS